MPLIDFPLVMTSSLTSHMKPDEFVDVMTTMDGGDTVAYAVGDLALDAAHSPMLVHLRGKVQEHVAAGRGYLTQYRRPDLPKRNGGFIFEYRFTKASPRKRPTPEMAKAALESITGALHG